MRKDIPDRVRDCLLEVVFNRSNCLAWPFDKGEVCQLLHHKVRPYDRGAHSPDTQYLQFTRVLSKDTSKGLERLSLIL